MWKTIKLNFEIQVAKYTFLQNHYCYTHFNFHATNNASKTFKLFLKKFQVDVDVFDFQILIILKHNLNSFNKQYNH